MPGVYEVVERLGLYGLVGLIVACGVSECPEGAPLTTGQAARYEAVAECLGTSAPEPTLRLVATCPCPTSGRMCCTCDAPFPCPWHPTKLCGIGGSVNSCGVITQPDQSEANGCGRVLEHESVHHVLRHATGDSDANHVSPHFGECA